jgi:DHA2 family multidrug resistance protein
VPVGIVAAFLVWTNLSHRDRPIMHCPVDIAGLVLLAVWVGSLQIMLDTGKDADWFSSPAIVFEAIVAVFGCVAWVIWESWDNDPIVDLSLFKFRNFALGTVAFCLGWAVYFGNIVLLPLWLQTNVGYTATWAGLVAAPSGLVAVLLTPIATRLMSRLDARIMATIAFLAFGISFFMRAHLTQDASFLALVLPVLVQGIGATIFFVSLITISLDGISPERIPSASGLSNFARITAGGFAASIITTFWDRRETLHQSRLSDIATQFSPTVQQATERLHQLGFSESQVYGVLNGTLEQQSYLLSTLDLFWISGWICIALVGVVWAARKSFSGSGSNAVSE